MLQHYSHINCYDSAHDFSPTTETDHTLLTNPGHAFLHESMYLAMLIQLINLHFKAMYLQPRCLPACMFPPSLPLEWCMFSQFRTIARDIGILSLKLNFAFPL